MSFPDVLLLIIRWLHALAAVAWVGGGLFYLLILRPSLRRADGSLGEGIIGLGERFRNLVNTTIAVLLVTGVILTVARLTSDYAGIPYVVVLVIKIALAFYMFYLVRFFRPHTYPAEDKVRNQGFQKLTSIFTGATTVLVIGVIVLLLADILRDLIEKGIEG